MEILGPFDIFRMIKDRNFTFGRHIQQNNNLQSGGKLPHILGMA